MAIEIGVRLCVEWEICVAILFGEFNNQKMYIFSLIKELNDIKLFLRIDVLIVLYLRFHSSIVAFDLPRCPLSISVTTHFQAPFSFFFFTFDSLDHCSFSISHPICQWYNETVACQACRLLYCVVHIAICTNLL